MQKTKEIKVLMKYFTNMDEKDWKILEQLLEDSSQTTSDISKKTGIPITTVHNRIKNMEEDGIITGYTVEVDHKKLGQGMAAYILVNVKYTLPDGTEISQEKVAKQIKAMEEVENVEIVTGNTDMVVKVRSGDVDQLNDFIIEKLRNVDGVDQTQTMVVLSSV